MKPLAIILCSVLLFGCGSSKRTTSGKATSKAPKREYINSNAFKISKASSDPEYGYTAAKPVTVGGMQEGPANERRYLNGLTGPNGEEVGFFRLGSCCPFETPNGFMGSGMLDIYRVTWQGATDTVSIYINMYDYGPLLAPVGFGMRE